MVSDIEFGAITDALNNKVDRDCNNLADTGKALISSLGMPSNRYIDLALGASGSTYTAPANGYYILKKQASAAGQGDAISD